MKVLRWIYYLNADIIILIGYLFLRRVNRKSFFQNFLVLSGHQNGFQTNDKYDAYSCSIAAYYCNFPTVKKIEYVITAKSRLCSI